MSRLYFSVFNTFMSRISQMTSPRSGYAIAAILLGTVLLVFAILCGVTPVHADQSQSFVWVGDAQGADNNDPINTAVLNPIVDSILALSTKPKVVIFGGDTAHRGGTTNLEKFKTLFTDRLTAAGIPSASTAGNHDLYTQSPASLTGAALTRQQEYQAIFNSSWTQNGPSAAYKNLAFSFHFGNSLFIMADSYYATENGPEPPYGINTTQQNWIQGLLKNNTASHSFFFTHIPAFNPWTPGSANDNMTDTWKTITTSGNANNTNASMMFSGHLHLYYRTFRDSTYQVTAGSAGAPLNCQEGETCGPVEPGDVYALLYNYAIVSINGREVTVKVLDQNNAQIDMFQYFDSSGVSNSVIHSESAISPDAALKQPTGILAASGNTITNNASISNVLTGIDAVSNNTITNSSSINPLSGGNGIHVYDNNTVTNAAAGSITGNSDNTTGFWGIRVNTGNSVENNGTITASGTNSIAFLAQGDNNTLTNKGTLSASGTGSYAAKFLGTGNSLVNSGTISGNILFNGASSSYTQNSNGTIQLKVASPTSNDVVTISGSAKIDGTLETRWQGGPVPSLNTKFGTILTASSGITGQFSSLLTNITPTIIFKPKYDILNQIYLVVERDYTNQTLFSSLSLNQKAVGSMLNPLANSASGDLDTVLGKIDALTTDAQVAAAFDQLSPIAGVAQNNMTSGVASFQTGNVASRLGDLRMGVQGFSFQGLENIDLLYANSPRQPFLLASNSDDLQGMIPVTPDPNWGFFVRGNLVLGDQKDTAGQRGYDFKNGGLTLGTDYRFSERFVGGVLFGMNAAKSWINDAGSTVKLDGYTLGIYGTYFREAFYIDGQAGYGWNSFDNSRRIVFPGVDRTATASSSGGQTTVYGGTGYDFQFGSWSVGPALTFQYLWMSVNGYTESGADSLNLQVDRQTMESYQGSAGVKGSWNWTKDKLKIAPRLWAFYRHEFGNVNPATIAALAQGSSAFTIESVAPERNFFNVGTGVNVHWTDRVLAYLNYEAQLSQSDYTAQNVTFGLRFQF